jgi:hypothetical protein
LGGGGGGAAVTDGSGNKAGAKGGDGVVILKYLSSYTISNPGGGLTFSTTSAGGYKITSFTAGTGNVSWS